MAKKTISWKTKGMNRDLSVSAFSSEFTFENRNLRLATNEGNTMLSWVNERGTKPIEKVEIELTCYTKDEQGDLKELYESYTTSILGTTIGTAVLNHKLVLFTASEVSGHNYIYVLDAPDSSNSTIKGKMLFEDNRQERSDDSYLNFDVEHPIETLVSYESENIQKVYWTDGISQPRFINIAPAMDKKAVKYKAFSFDFVPELQLNEEVTVEKIFGSGSFPAGVIQYAFTYYNEYGQESCVFHVTPLQYISHIDRGGSAESTISNSFRIKVSGLDKNYDYLRIYSILRTAVDTTPYTKRVQDIKIGDQEEIIYTDDGYNGDTVDPTELLYKGGEDVAVQTMEQKDGTLFLGNIKVITPSLYNLKNEDGTSYNLQQEILKANGVDKANKIAKASGGNIYSVNEDRYFKEASKKPLTYLNTLSAYVKKEDTAKDSTDYSYKGASCFKARETYRLGVQFQYKNGKWSDPLWIGDAEQGCTPGIDEDNAKESLPEFRYCLFTKEAERDEITGIQGVFKSLYEAGYRKVRGVFAAPKLSDRTILCQGVISPTVYRMADRLGENNASAETLHTQSSWLFRTLPTGTDTDNAITYTGFLKSQFDTPFENKSTTDSSGLIVSPYLRNTEIMGVYGGGKNDDDYKFQVTDSWATMHSPEFIFDDDYLSQDFSSCVMRLVGEVQLSNTYGDISIQTSTPTISGDASGYKHHAVVTNGDSALISGLFFEDYLVEAESSEKFVPWSRENYPVDFIVYMWQKNGSLNNDTTRANRSANLLKKVISNYRLGSSTTYFGTNLPTTETKGIYDYNTLDMRMFSSDQLSIIKVDGNIYMGNIDTVLTPKSSPVYIVGNPKSETPPINDFYTASSNYRLYYDDNKKKAGVQVLSSIAVDGKLTEGWEFQDDTQLGAKQTGLCMWKESIRMKYKSTPHLVAKLRNAASNSFFHATIYPEEGAEKTVNLVDGGSLPLVEITRKYDKDTLYGGTSDDAMTALTWIPCGPAQSFDANTDHVEIEYKWGDTYVQRFECLKTYPFTSEDINQVIEIASFVCETRVNIDGRYDRNRAQVSNLLVTPENFNLLNPVYSQMDNFFSYKIQDEDSYTETSFPNIVAWTMTKQNGADVDMWTHLTLANVMELDGDKGEVTKIVKLDNLLLALQDKGLSQILYNENTQISTTDGVPIELANSGKVQGKRYISSTVGCSNKWSVVQTPGGMYFMDSNNKGIYHFNGQNLTNLSSSGGFNSWAKQNIPSATEAWNPKDYNNFVSYYDVQNQDVLFINNETALAFSERMGCFTSFYDYGGIPYFNTLDDISVWATKGKDSNTHLWAHQKGDYCKFFGENKPYSMTLVANQDSQVDKIFTNIEFRACVSDEGNYDKEASKFTPFLPVDSIEAWDEYQHGILKLSLRNADRRNIHGGSEGVIDRKFRIWRSDLPRDNATLDKETESAMGISRVERRPLDRLRNTWAYIKLKKEAATEKESLHKTEIHDVLVTYFS